VSSGNSNELANKKLVLANAVEDLHLQENVQMQGWIREETNDL